VRWSGGEGVTELASLLVEALSLLVAVVAGVYTAMSYYVQRTPRSTREAALAAAARPWQALLGVAAAVLLAVGILQVAARPPLWVWSGYGLGVIAAALAMLGRARALRICLARLAREQSAHAAAADAAKRRARVAGVSELLAGVHADGQLPRVGDPALPLYARWVGVARSRYADGHDPYIARPAVDRAVDEAAGTLVGGPGRTGGVDRLMLVVGPSKAGKTRAALEGLRRHGRLADAPLLVPRSGRLDDLARLDPPLPVAADPVVLWLDDLERYLTGHGRLTPELLGRLRGTYPNLVAVATMTTSRYQGFRNLPRRTLRPLPSPVDFTQPGLVTSAVTAGWPAAAPTPATAAAGLVVEPGDLPDRHDGNAAGLVDEEARELVEAARLVLVPVDFAEDGERQAAKRAYPDEDFARGPGEQLVAAWEHDALYRTCPDADPICWAVVQAAIDWRRAGLTRPMGERALRGLAHQYLPRHGPMAFPGPARLAEAIARAQLLPTESPVKALDQVAEEPEPAFSASDYLVECADGRNDAAARPIPDETWTALATELAPIEELRALARTARRRIQGTLTDTRVLAVSSERLLETGQDHLVATGHLIGGVLLVDQNDQTGARAAFERACATTRSEIAAVAMNNLGWLAERRGELDEAERLFRQAARAGHAGGLNNLGWLAERRGELGEAEGHYREAADAGDAVAIHNLGWLAERRGELGEAERRFRQAADAGEAGELNNLGWLAKQRGDLAGAERLFRQAADAGQPGGLNNLGWLAEGRGELGGAERLYRRAADAGDAVAMHNLGVLAERRGELDEAERQFRRAADAGNAVAMRNLGVLAERRGELEEAERRFRQAADAGEPGGLNNLGWLAEGRGDLAAAERFFRQAADAGDAVAIRNLEVLAEARAELADGAPA
jgi:Flp pilus assembly protein TadD